MVSIWFLVLKDNKNCGSEKRLLRIMVGNKRKIVKITQLGVYNLCD